jgi:hypothetical protein
MLRLRMAGTAACIVFAALVASVAIAPAQTPPPPMQETQAASPVQEPLTKRRKRGKTEPKPQTFEESTRFLKSLPPKPATQLPYPSIATPPVEDQAPIPLLTEAQRKKQEDDLTKLNERHRKGMPKEAVKAKAAKTKPAKPKPQQEAAKPLQITK